MKDPALLWYFNDWTGGTATMSRHLKGCYMDLLAAQFNSGPLSLDEIKTVLGTDFGQAWPALQKKFVKDDSNCYFNERLHQEKEKRIAFTESRRKSAYARHTHMRTDNENRNENINENEIRELIRAFEKINAGAKKFYGYPAQRTACKNLIDAYSFDRVKSVIELTLPKTNQIPYMPTIISPAQLRDKWASLEANIIKNNAKAISEKNKNGVAFW